MLYNNLLTSLPFYEKVVLQDRFRPQVANDTIFAQLAPIDGLLPFQFRKPTESMLPKAWRIKCADTNKRLEDYLDGYEDDVVADLTDFIATQLEYATLVDADGVAYDYFWFTYDTNSLGALISEVPSGLPHGYYYIEFLFDVLVTGETYEEVAYCSEIFKVPEDETFLWNAPDSCKYITLKWYNDADIDPIHYLNDNSLYNLVYLETFITSSEPEVEIEQNPDGYNEPIPTNQKAVIKYRMSMLVPDYLKIAFYAMQIHDYIELTTERNLRSGQLKNIDVQYSLTTDAAYSAVDIVFEQMRLIVKTACPVSMESGGVPTIDEGLALTTSYCQPTGAVSAIMPDVPEGVYGKLQYKFGGSPWVDSVSYIGRADLLTGWSGFVTPPGTALTKFRIAFYNFTGFVGYSAESTPSSSC